jgi:uncharacterized protein
MSSSLPAVKSSLKPRVWVSRLVATLVMLFGALFTAYAGISLYVATALVQQTVLPVTQTPASLGLQYQDVVFPARQDHVMIHGWLIPGVLPDGQLTVQRTLIMLHGRNQNRTDPAAGLLDLSGALARNGFAVLAIDMRGAGESPPAPMSLGYYEQRDALGAVDFLQSGPEPYPALGRPRVIGGWGASMGAITLLLAAAKEPAIKAVVADSAYPEVVPIFEREIPKEAGIPAFSIFSPGGLLATDILYGINFYADRPGDIVASLAPRPLLFIQGASDTYNPPSNLGVLVHDAEAAPNANVQSWLVPGAGHAQAYHVAGAGYVDRLVAFYTAALGSDTNS